MAVADLNGAESGDPSPQVRVRGQPPGVGIPAHFVCRTRFCRTEPGRSNRKRGVQHHHDGPEATHGLGYGFRNRKNSFPLQIGSVTRFVASEPSRSAQSGFVRLVVR